MRACSDTNLGLPVPRSYREAVKSWRGYKRAVVATAHKMLRTIYAMLRDGEAYVGVDEVVVADAEPPGGDGFVIRPTG